MEGQLTASQRQMSFMDQTEPLWCERTQDMSGFVLPDIILPLSDEHLQLEFSTAHHENDIDVQHYENPTLEEFTMKDSLDSVLREDSDMFDNSNNYNLLDTNIKAWLPKISNTEIDEFAKISMINENGDFRAYINTENPPTLSQIPKMEKKLPVNIIQKSNCFSIFESEEPVINEDLETLSSCCTENKEVFELRDEMEVAEEVVVTTEYDELESNESPFLLNSDPIECSVIKIEEDIIKDSEDMSSPLTDLSTMETPYDINMQFDEDENFLDSFNIVTSLEKVTPKLHLDVAAAMGTGSLLSANLPDTPDMLKTVFNPDSQFDFVRYMKDDNDPNNNDTILPEPPPSPRNPKHPQRKGKSQLSLEELKESQSRSPILLSEAEPEPSTTTSSKRPTRKSATNFKRRMQEGLLNSKPSPSDSSDEDEYVPKAKQRKLSYSSNGRKRINSDSDRSSICEDALKYRERRDRNNLSSKKSRQKRKAQQEEMKIQLQKLEEENRRLKNHAEKLVKALQNVNTFWKEHLKSMNKKK